MYGNPEIGVASTPSTAASAIDARMHRIGNDRTHVKRKYRQQDVPVLAEFQRLAKSRAYVTAVTQANG